MLVYHYCSLESLNSILKHRALRLTNILKSNDSMEISWICRYFQEAFRQAYEQASEHVHQKISKERMDGLIRFYTDEFFNESHSCYRFYVTCFSKEADLLSQWRGYADDGRGVAIGYDLDVLKTIASGQKTEENQSVSLHEINYSEEKQKAIVESIVAGFMQKLEGTADGSEYQDMGGMDDILYTFEETFLELFKASVYMKNPFFSEESEIRLCEFAVKKKMEGENIELPLGARLYNYSYYVKQNQFVSYVDFDFSSCMKQLIRGLTIGPKCLTSVSDMEYYLSTFGITDCEIIKSAGTYR